MAVNRAIEVLYQNQMQFNLDVPLTASNIASHCHKPGPILVERISGQNAIPGKPHVHKAALRNPNVSASSSFNYAMLSEDRMTKVSQLAKRDLKNRRLQMQREREKSPSAESVVLMQRRQQSTGCTRQRRPPTNKPKTPLRAREAEKNRRIGSVQTPPPPRRSMPSSSNSLVADDSVPLYNVGDGENSQQTDNFFPLKPAKSNLSLGGPKDEMGKLQQELESYLQTLCRIGQQVLRNGSAEFLQNRVKGKTKNNFLAEEEDMDRVRIRAGEHNTRSARNLYNLCQKVKQLRDVSQSDLSKPTKKSQISTHLNATYRGAVRALQVFVSQLPYQDLQMGLPSTYNELALLLRQLTTLMTLTQHGSKDGADGDLDNNVLTLLDQADNLNSKWCSMALQSNRVGQHANRKAMSTNQNGVQRAWVSDTKVDADLMSKNVTEFTARIPSKAAAASTKKTNVGLNRPVPKQHQRVKERYPRAGGNVGKENRNALGNQGLKSTVNKSSLTGQKTFGFVSLESKLGQSSKSVVRDIDHTKGYMLPPDLMEKRERAQRAVELSNKNFADSTHSSRSKSSKVQRPHSAPSPGRKKEVNFDLPEDKRSHQPWIPAGCAPCKQQRARSSSAERNPFYVKSMDDQDLWDFLPERHARSVMMQDRPAVSASGYRSLPTERRLRSFDVSDSFVSLIEKRILQRMLQEKTGMGEMRQSRKNQMLYSSNEALDITDLTVDESYDVNSLNTTAEAASVMDAPTLENIKLKLTDMERTRREIRQRWSSLKFVDTNKKSRHKTNDCPVDPPVFDYTRETQTKTRGKRHRLDDEFDEPVNKAWTEEPLLFTKPVSKSNSKAVTKTAYSTTVQFPPKLKPQVRLNPTTLDKILEDRERFEDHLRKHSHHPTGKFDPWSLMEEISEEILKECMQEVSEEVEKVSEEIANQMYKSEFLVTGRPSESDVFDTVPTTDHKDHDVVFEDLVENATMPSDQDLYRRLEGFGEDYGVGREFGMGEETPRSPGSSANEFEPVSHGVPSEPMLDNVSQLVQEKVEGLVDYPEGKRDEEDDDDNYDDEYEEEDEEEEDGGQSQEENSDRDRGDVEYDDEEEKEDDEGNDDYSDDEFENVSDVEL